MIDNSDPVFRVVIEQSLYLRGELTSRTEVRHNSVNNEPSWDTGDKLLSTGWYYWNETWGSCYGPFGSEEECRASLAVYCSTI